MNEQVQTGGRLCAMTVDVEDYYHVAAFAKNIATDDWSSMPSRVEKNTRLLLELFEQNGIKITFFVLGWIAERYPELIREIDEAGHEIASHGYSHELIYNQSPELFREETHKSKDLLENIIQKDISGYRGSSYSITRRSLWALDILTELGFSWDSSIFPVRHDRYGIPGTPTRPYRIKTGNGGEILEFPLTTTDIFGIRLPAAGGGYFRLYPYWLSKFLLNKACEDKPGIFYLHPWEVDPDQPRIENASLVSRFRHYNNLDRCLGRLNRLLDDFSFDTVAGTLSTLDELDELEAASLG